MEGPDRDKERILNKMKDFDSLLNENPFVQKTKAEGIAEGEIKASQKAIVTIVRGRFPALTELAQEEVVKIDKPDVLDYLIEQVSTAPDEAMIRQLLRSTAA
jgi:hypothetical protein